VTFAASVVGSDPAPVGTVDLYDGGTLRGAEPLVGGRAVFTMSFLTKGDHLMMAQVRGGTSAGALTTWHQTVLDGVASTAAGGQIHDLARTGGGTPLPVFALALLFLVTGSTLRSASRTRT